MATDTKAPKKAKTTKAESNKGKAIKLKSKEKDSGEVQEGVVLDLTKTSVKKMIKAAKKRGYVTVDELNSVMP